MWQLRKTDQSNRAMHKKNNQEKNREISLLVFTVIVETGTI